MPELLAQQKFLGAALLCFMPTSESLQHDSMQNLVSRSFLFSLWWKECTCFAVLVSLALLVAVRLALRGKAARRPATEKDILPHPLATDPSTQIRRVQH
jgi:hypothetical protein